MLAPDAVLQQTRHRPWPLPPGPWAMAQTWHDLLFAHWPLPPDVLRDRVPAPLQVDTFEGQGWIAVVPFRMLGVHPRRLPSVPWLSAFPELNVRTYVVAEDKPGVYFFSLDAGNRVAVEVARRWYHLPYFHARMNLAWLGGTCHYVSSRIHRGAPPAQFLGRYRPVGEVFHAEPGTLVHWFTERYCLYAVDAGQRVYRTEIHHAPWPLQPAEAEFDVNTVTRPAAIGLPDTPPLLHFARRLEVRAWSPQLVR